MGLKMESGCRRGQGRGYSAVVVPRCGPASPFKGHLSTKSNAFCTDSSRNLTDQYLIRDHMMCHYNRILSAKAAVDCSVPKSRLSSIKLADQQRREKLKKKIGGCEEKTNFCEPFSRSCPRDNRRLLPPSFRKSFFEVEDNLFPCAGHARCPSKAPSPFREHCVVHSSPVKRARKCPRNVSRAPHSSVCPPRPLSKHSGFLCCHSVVNGGCSQMCQGYNPKVNSGDLLERHPECFTKSRKPFTPRTLISNAKSLLPEYKYYTPARRKKNNHRKQRMEAQTQTDVFSFPSGDKVCVGKVMCEHQKIPSKAEAKRCALDEPERETEGCQCSILRETSQCPQKKCSQRKTVEAEEEELLYLTFIEDVTDEILRLGLFSNRVLDKLFECYIKENKNRLDEGKMRQMLDVLKSELGCCQDSDTVTREGQDSERELIRDGQDSETELVHANLDAKTDLVHASLDSETDLSRAGLDSKTELIHTSWDRKTKVIHAGQDSKTELLRGGQASETELSHAGLDSETELIRAHLDRKTKLTHAGQDRKTKLTHAGQDRKTELLRGGQDSETELSHAGLDSKTELIRAHLDRKTKLTHAGQDRKTELIHGGQDSETELSHAGLDSETELIHASRDRKTKPIHEGLDRKAKQIHAGRDSKTELIRGGQDSKTELIRADLDSETELVHEDQDRKTKLIHAGLDSETELIDASLDSETELICAGLDSDTELSHAGLDSETELSHAGLDSEIELICGGRDRKTKLTHAGLDSKTELIRGGRDRKTKLAHASLDSETELIRGGRDRKTKLAHAGLDSETELIRGGRDRKTKLAHASLDSETELIRGGQGRKTKLAHASLDSETELIRADLDSETELIQASREASESLGLQESDRTEELKFTSKGHRLRKATESEELLETINLSLQEPNKCESLSYSERSREIQSRENFSEDTTETMDAGTESDYCGVEFEEHSDTSPTCQAALNSIVCDSDLDVNKELYELEEDLADALRISRNYSYQ